MKQPWTPDSWREKKVKFQIEYEDSEGYQNVLRDIAAYPPLVVIGEIERLKKRLAAAGRGEGFILHGGDCVERFTDCREERVLNKIKIILQMSMILTHALRKPVFRIGRIGGQYFKPRSKETEINDRGEEILTYRGDSIHSFSPDLEGRKPDPQRLKEAFFHSSVTLNYIRALMNGGFADLHNPYKWNLHDIEKTAEWEEYREIVGRILEAIHFMESFGGVNPDSLNRAEFFTSHEGLHLDYESALTKKENGTDRFYNTGTHLLWVGERTRDTAGAHIEYVKGLENPIGVKVGPDCTADEIVSLAETINPSNEEGKLIFITRFGARYAAERLTKLLKAVKEAGKSVVWVSDPMHGNTSTTGEGVKTRDFDNILEEIRAVYRTVTKEGVPFGGVHFELTGEDVTECTGGAVNVSKNDLSRNYTTYCDPRLNYSQSMEMAFLISQLMRG